jgi:hypothetical protein
VNEEAVACVGLQRHVKKIKMDRLQTEVKAMKFITLVLLLRWQYTKM